MLPVGHAGAPHSTPHVRPPQRPSLLAPFLVAVFVTALSAWTVYAAAQRSVAYDLTGHVESLLPLARLGMLSAPFIVAFRALVATVSAWLMAGALHERVALRVVGVAVLTFMPLLEVPVLADAIAVLLSPEARWAELHIPLGLEALVPEATGTLRILLQSLNAPLLVWTALLARALSTRLTRGWTTAIPAAAAAATVLVLLPLLRGA